MLNRNRAALGVQASPQELDAAADEIDEMRIKGDAAGQDDGVDPPPQRPRRHQVGLRRKLLNFRADFLADNRAGSIAVCS